MRKLFWIGFAGLAISGAGCFSPLPSLLSRAMGLAGTPEWLGPPCLFGLVGSLFLALFALVKPKGGCGRAGCPGGACGAGRRGAGVR